MAKGDSSTTDTKTPDSSAGSVSQLPQQNQTLSGNPSTDTQAQTRWMEPGTTSPYATDISSSIKQPDQSQPVQNGTMLGQITAGQVGQFMPGGYDAGKFGDPNKHDPKYDVGRILSKYPPGPEGLQAARNELQQAGYQIVGKDKIQGPAGIIDVGFSFSDPNAQHSWQWNPEGGPMQGNQMPGNSFFGQQQGNNQNNFLQQMFQQMMAQRQQYANQQFNPTGGGFNQMVPGGGITGGMDKSGGYTQNPGMPNPFPSGGSTNIPQFGGMIGQQPIQPQMPGDRQMLNGGPKGNGNNYDPRRMGSNGIMIQ